MDKTNPLGFDVYQMQVIKRNYQNQKKLIIQKNKLYEKAKLLMSQAKAIQEEISSMDSQVPGIAKKVVGMSLSSEECMKYVNNPQLWNRLQTTLNNKPACQA